MTIFNGGGGGGTVVVNGMLMVGRGGEWEIKKTYCCMPELNLTTKFKYSALLCCQLRGILSI